LGERVEQLVGASQEGTAVIDVIRSRAGGVDGGELALAVLANHAFAQVLNADL
jgi:hypothetical protein